MTNPNDIAIEITGATKRFGRAMAVDNLSLQVPRGTVFGFVGPNGAGKTTTIRMLMGLLPIDSGKITVLGLDAARDGQAIRSAVGYVPEQHLMYRWMTVGELTRFCSRLYPTWNHDLCQSLLDRFGLPADKKVKALSKGNITKLSLLLAIAHDSQLLVLDEPTAGVDPLVREEFLQSVLDTACGQRRTVLFSSHTLSDVQRLADNVGIIHQGRLICHAPLAGLLAGTKRVRLAMETTAAPPLPPWVIFHAASGRELNVTVTDFSEDKLEWFEQCKGLQVLQVADVALEDVFKDYVRGQKVTT
jgi:ABC-2 type transport system ATP-binding protein